MAQIFFGTGPSGLWHDALGRNRNLQSPGVLFLLTPFWLSCYDFSWAVLSSADCASRVRQASTG